jgi:CheY-like chemotaxis protein
MNLPSPLIIAVDDEADDIFFLRHAIQKAGVPSRFQPFSNGEAAKVALGAIANGEDPANFPLVCFLDIKMGGMTGFDLLRWIRSEKGLDALPVIMYSSSDHPEDVDKARDLGAQGYLKKHPSVIAMQPVLAEAKSFAATVPPKKTFLQWSYRFIDSRDAVAAR